MTVTNKNAGSTTVVGAVSDELSFGASSANVGVAHVRSVSHGKLVPAMFRVRKLAQERGVDLAKVQGTGPNGAILESDLKLSS